MSTRGTVLLLSLGLYLSAAPSSFVEVQGVDKFHVNLYVDLGAGYQEATSCVGEEAGVQYRRLYCACRKQCLVKILHPRLPILAASANLSVWHAPHSGFASRLFDFYQNGSYFTVVNGVQEAMDSGELLWKQFTYAIRPVLEPIPYNATYTLQPQPNSTQIALGAGQELRYTYSTPSSVIGISVAGLVISGGALVGWGALEVWRRNRGPGYQPLPVN